MASETKITFLGGLGDIGRNCMALETEGKLLILDCGQLFAGYDRPGVDAILPDLDYLMQRADSIVGMIATHGHEDHIGAIAYLFKAGVKFPIYSSEFTLGMIGHRLAEAGHLKGAEFNKVADGETHQIGPFSVEFLPVTHSIPNGLISAITTPQGVVLHSSDLKLDPDPVDGRLTDLDRIAEISEDPGIRMLLCDSTNANQEGKSLSETDIGPVLEDVFADNEGRRIICAAFSSHIHRVQQMVDAAQAHGRTIATLGLSMKRNVGLARELGVLDLPDRDFIDIADIDDYADGDLLIISTGSQGEARAALAQASLGRNKWINFTDNDTVILSSTAIPGNEEAVANMINRIMRVGARVVHSGQQDVHTSGHGKRGELALLHEAANAEWFVPVHGEEQHMRAHMDLAWELGMDQDRVLLARDGDQVSLTDGGAKVHRQITPGTHMLVHGNFVGPDRGVVEERIILQNAGMVSAIVTVDFEDRVMLGAPVVISRGWLDTPQLSSLHAEIASEVSDWVAKALREKDVEPENVRRAVRKATGQYVNDRSRRRPMIVPVVIEA